MLDRRLSGYSYNNSYLSCSCFPVDVGQCGMVVLACGLLVFVKERACALGGYHGADLVFHSFLLFHLCLIFSEQIPSSSCKPPTEFQMISETLTWS